MRIGPAAVAALLSIAAPAPAQQARGNLSAEDRARRAAEQERELQEALRTPRPIEAVNSVWIEELTWMEVRDALAAGQTTVIIPTGGIEQNGPYLATGKHNYVLRAACDMMARRLGNALCAPIVPFVPEGDLDRPSGHMRYPGTISLRQETFERLLDDIGTSLKAHGFKHLIYIGDSGGNQNGMKAVAQRQNERWGHTLAYYLPEFYDKGEVVEWMGRELGIKETADDGLHDGYVITAEIMITDPRMVRYDQRVAAGKATINGLSIAPKETTIEIGRKLLGHRVDRTIRAFEAARQ